MQVQDHKEVHMQKTAKKTTANEAININMMSFLVSFFLLSFID